jgi:hypothetical protein
MKKRNERKVIKLFPATSSRLRFERFDHLPNL